jgi:hypothetical protein
MFGPFGLGLVGALVYASAGVVVQKLASQHQFKGDDMPWCLPALTSWHPVPCAAGSTPLTAYDWGVRLFQTGIVPLLYVAGLVLVMFAGTAVGAALSLVVGRIRSGVKLSGTVFLRRLFHVSPGAVAIALAPAAALVLLTYVPDGDHVLVWQHGGTGPVGAVGGLVTAAAGWLITGVLAAARALKLGTGTLLGEGTIGDGVRVPLDLAYDIATFLREPIQVPVSLSRHPAGVARLKRLIRARQPVPRQRILGRFSALLAHIDGVREYRRCVIVSHSQGTALATALLHQRRDQLRIPGGHVSLVTMGTPLRRQYAQRLPMQFEWVDDLVDRPDGFVRSLDGPWLNFGADGDLVGRTIFTDESDESMQQGPIGDRCVAGRVDWNIGPGGHGSYWTSPFVMQQIADQVLPLVPAGSKTGVVSNGARPAPPVMIPPRLHWWQHIGRA